MRNILLRGGRVVDPSQDLDSRLDLLISDGTIAEIAESIEAGSDVREIDLGGAVVAPGLVDMHVHLRDPGREDEETIASGSEAAVHGGVTALAAMPNTEPAIDTPSWVEYVRTRSHLIDVHPIAAITVGRRGETLTEMAELAAAGAVAFSDDGSPVASARVMRRALEYADMVGRPVVSHCEDLDLVGDGVANEGLASTISGLRPSPAAAEDVAVARDVILAGATGARVHIAHVSTRGSVQIVRRAKADGIRVTCETCPHYFALTDDAVRSYDTSLRINPPLRSEEDVAAIRTGLADGTIDAIASDHAPHSLEEKQVEFDAAPPGAIGLETLLPVTITHLVETGVIGLARAIELLSASPARILRIEGGTLARGARADVTVFDPARSWTLERAWFRSKSKNSPFIGATLLGRVAITISKGRIVFEEGPAPEGAPDNAHEERAADVGELPLRA